MEMVWIRRVMLPIVTQFHWNRILEQWNRGKGGKHYFCMCKYHCYQYNTGKCQKQKMLWLEFTVERGVEYEKAVLVAGLRMSIKALEFALLSFFYWATVLLRSGKNSLSSLYKHSNPRCLPSACRWPKLWHKAPPPNPPPKLHLSPGSHTASVNAVCRDPIHFRHPAPTPPHPLCATEKRGTIELFLSLFILPKMVSEVCSIPSWDFQALCNIPNSFHLDHRGC